MLVYLPNSYLRIHLHYFGKYFGICPNFARTDASVTLCSFIWRMCICKMGFQDSHLFFNQCGFMHIKDFLKVRSGAIYLLY